MNPPQPRTSRKRAGAVIALFGFCVIAAAWANVLLRSASERTSEIERCQRENAALARAFEEHVRRVVQTADSALVFLQSEYEKSGEITPSMRDFVERTRGDSILGEISLVDARGDLVLSPVRYDVPVNCYSRDHFQQQLRQPDLGLHIGKPVVKQVAGAWSFFLSRRLEGRDGSFAGIVAVALAPEYFSGFYGDPSLGEDRAVLLAGMDGIVRARHARQGAQAGQDIGDSALFREFRKAPRGSCTFEDPVDGLTRYGSYCTMAEYPLVVAVGSREDSALASFRQRRTTYLLGAVAFTVFVGGFCALLVRADRRTRWQHQRLAEELSERRKAEVALRESQSVFSAFMEHVPAVVFLKDLEDRILYTNTAFRNLYGGSLIGQTTMDLPGVEPAVAEAIREDDRRTLREGAIQVEETVRDREGRERTFETRKFVIRPGDGPSLLGGVAVDVSDRRRMEEERLALERQMQQAQKMESLGILAGGIAHDFNNLLMAIMGNLELSLKQPAKSNPHAYIERAVTAAQRAAEVTNQLLAYSGKGRFIVGPVDLAALVEEMQPLLETVISKRATLLLRQGPAGELPAVQADATQLRQVLMNLITNASDALRDGEGTIAVTTGVAERPPEMPGTGTPEASPSPGPYVYLEVTDDGCGMDAATQARVFDPFFTTKEAGRGLGMASVLGIVRGHGGVIDVRSEPERGTTFRVYFPAGGTTAPPAAGRNGEPPVQAALGRATILVVDDQEAVRAVARELLEACGFDVLTAEDGLAAVETFRARGGEIDAVVLDLTMPRMGGEEALRELHRLREDLPVVLASGYSELDDAHRFAARGLVAFVQKPYRIQALLEALTAVLSGSREGSADADPT